MKINQEELLKEAKRSQVSVYLLIKRRINYHKKDSRDYKLDNCGNCYHATLVDYKNRKNVMQCKKIGIINDWEHYADVQKGYVCNLFKRGYNNLKIYENK